MGQDGIGQRLGRGCATTVVDVQAIRLHTDGDDLRPQFMEDAGRRLVGRAMGTIDDDLQSAKIEIIGEGALAELDVATARIFDTHGPPEIRSTDTGHFVIDAGLNGLLDLIREFGTLSREKLDAIIVVRVVRCRDDNPRLQAQGTGQVGDRRCRNRPDQAGIDAGCRETGLESGFQHVTREPGVLADQYRRTLAARHAASTQQNLAGSVAETHDKIRRDR